MSYILFVSLCFFRELEDENASLQAEYEHLQLHQNNMSMSDENKMNSSGGGQDIMTEAKLLRQHKVNLLLFQKKTLCTN